MAIFKKTTAILKRVPIATGCEKAMSLLQIEYHIQIKGSEQF